MQEDTMTKASSILEYLLKDAQIDAIRFRGDAFTILFTPMRVNAGEVYLHIDSGWRVKIGDSIAYEYIDGIAESAPEKQILELYSLRSKPITSVTLVDPYPSLSIVFADDVVLTVNGYHEQYESWELGTAIKEPSDDFHLVAISGGRLAMWHPDTF